MSYGWDLRQHVGVTFRWIDSFQAGTSVSVLDEHKVCRFHVSPCFTLVEGRCMVQAFNRHSKHRAQVHPSQTISASSQARWHLPLCDFCWQSCSEVTVASLVSGIMVLLVPLAPSPSCACGR